MAILAIKLGALGDIILSECAFQAIKNHHESDKIILLTTPPFEKITKKMGVFDQIIAFPRFPIWDFANWKKLLNRIKSEKITRIYDLQMVNRTKIYFYIFRHIFKNSFEWVGHIKSSPFCINFEYFKKHPLDRFSNLLSTVGILKIPEQDIRRLGEPITFDIQKPYVLMCASASNSFNGAKIWHQSGFCDVARFLNQKGISTVIIGGKNDDHSFIAKNYHYVLDLTGKTTFEQVITLAKHAFFAFGNDTGPMHIAAASQCPVFVLFSKKALPSEQVGPKGPFFFHFTSNDLNEESSSEVITELNMYIDRLNS